jgi:hypothetical protein
VIPSHGVLEPSLPATATTAAPIPVSPARRAPGVGVPWRYLGASARFAAVASLTVVAALLLLDWVLFDTPVVAPRLRIVDDPLPAEKLLLAARYPDARVLYLGDSRILVGIDPSAVSETCRCGPGYNGAFVLADSRMSRIMARRLLETLSPEVVVIGVSQWALSDAANINLNRPGPDLLAPWEFAEFGLTLDPKEQVEATLGRAWRLYRFRDELRATLDPWTTVRSYELPRGYLPNPEPPGLDPRGLEGRRRAWFGGFSVQGHRAEALRGLIGDLRARGLRTMLVAPPLHDALHARVRVEVDAFRAAIEQLAGETGATFEDLTEAHRTGLTTAHFEDFVHLNDDGAVRFSRQLGRVIRRHLGSG